MAVSMASRVKVQWLWRDLRLLYVLLVWAAFGSSLFYFFNGGIMFQGAASVPPHRAASASAPPPQSQSDDEIYTGSVIVVPPRGDKCWQMMLDNRTGRMWENGYVDCYVAVRELAENKRNGAISSVRMQSISNAFRGQEK
jgi:hypothetical protein